jgi:hypothetical protein
MSAVAFLNTFSAIGKSISRLERQMRLKLLKNHLLKIIYSPPDFAGDPR